MLHECKQRNVEEAGAAALLQAVIGKPGKMLLKKDAERAVKMTFYTLERRKSGGARRTDF